MKYIPNHILNGAKPNYKMHNRSRESIIEAMWEIYKPHEIDHVYLEPRKMKTYRLFFASLLAVVAIGFAFPLLNRPKEINDILSVLFMLNALVYLGLSIYFAWFQTWWRMFRVISGLLLHRKT